MPHVNCMLRLMAEVDGAVYVSKIEILRLAAALSDKTFIFSEYRYMRRVYLPTLSG